METLPPMRRTILLDYRGMQIEAKVQSLSEECELRASVKVKSYAVDAGLLQPLFCEAMLVGMRPTKAKNKLAPELLSAYSAAREMANNLMDDSAKDGATINAELAKRESALVSMVRSFKVEMSFMLSMAGSVGEAKLREKFESMLPTLQTARSLETAVTEATALQASDLFQFCSNSTQGEVAAACEMLNNMLQGRSPFRNSMSAIPWHMKIRTLLPNFYRVNTGTAAKPKTVVGAQAVQHTLEQLRSSDAAALKLDALEPLHIYGWLLEDDDSEWVVDTTAKVIAKADKKSSSSKGSSAAAPKANAGCADVADAMSMFSSRK